jgi:primosomal protein N'
MKVLAVAPLSSGIPYEELSYFAKDDVEVGDLIEVSVKKRNVRALVINAEKAEHDRQALRQASFNLKKSGKMLTKHLLPHELWTALFYSSSYLLVHLGTMLYDLMSEKSFANLKQFHIAKDGAGFEILLLQESYENRLTRYKTTIREYFSKKKSLVIFFPTITDLEYAREALGKGIENYVVSLHSSLTDKQMTQTLLLLQKEDHPLLILSTPSLLPWQRTDLGLIILEREHSQYYYTHGDNGYDMRFVLKRFAQASNIPCLLGSHMLSMRAHLFWKKRDAHEVMPLHFRNDSAIDIVQMTDENKSASPYLSRKTLSMLHTAKQDKKGHYFLYSHRKGMYPTTVCSDCGTIFACPDCNRPYVLHKVAGVRTYICHGCENIVRIDEDTTLARRHCGGWRMQLLGIATGGVEEELKRLGIPLFLIDGEHTSTRAKVKKVYREWKESPYGVLIGTEMAHNILDECDGITILSLDSLFSLPEYRTDEKIINLVTEMAEKVRKSDHGGRLILQTRLKNMPAVKLLSSHTLLDVYNTILAEREELLLPPHYVVIKASFDNLSDGIRSRMEQELEPYVVDWFEAGRGITLVFIHIKETEWANQKIVRDRVKRIIFDGKPSVNPLHFFI